MRRLFTLGIVVGLVVASAAPAGADRVKPEAIQGVECIVEFGAPERVWFTGEDGKIVHLRGITNIAMEYVHNGDGWVHVGWNTIEVNYNGAYFPMPTPDGLPIPIPIDGTFWGTFDLQLQDVGDFTGHWSWGKGAVDGRGSGSGDGQLIKVDLLGEDPGLPTPYPCLSPGFVEYAVTTK